MIHPVYVASIFLLCLYGSCFAQSTIVRATNGVADSTSEAYFCFLSTSDPTNNVTDLTLNYGDVSPYFFLNVSTSWMIGVYSDAGCQSGSLLATTNVTVDPAQAYTVSFIGLFANTTEAIAVYGYTPPKPDAGTYLINLYFQAQNTSSVNLALFLPDAVASSLSVVEDQLYASSGYQVSETLGELRTDVIYDFIEDKGSITGVVVRQNYTFSEQTSYSVFALGILDHTDYDLKVVIVVDDSDSTSGGDVEDGSSGNSGTWVWIMVIVGIVVILTVVICIPVCVVVVILVIRKRKHASYQQFKD